MGSAIARLRRAAEAGRRDRLGDPTTLSARLRRQEVIGRYAKLYPNSSRPVLCIPSPWEVAGVQERRNHEGNDGKVIYPDRSAAQACADELARLGYPRGVPYRCERSRHGHYHLTTVGGSR